MGRIVAQVRLTNLRDTTKTLNFAGLVDTCAAQLVLPSAWKDNLGTLDLIREVTCELGNQTTVPKSVAAGHRPARESSRRTSAALGGNS